MRVSARPMGSELLLLALAFLFFGGLSFFAEPALTALAIAALAILLLASFRLYPFLILLVLTSATLTFPLPSFKFLNIANALVFLIISAWFLRCFFGISPANVNQAHFLPPPKGDYKYFWGFYLCAFAGIISILGNAYRISFSYSNIRVLFGNQAILMSPFLIAYIVSEVSNSKERIRSLQWTAILVLIVVVGIQFCWIISRGSFGLGYNFRHITAVSTIPYGALAMFSVSYSILSFGLSVALPKGRPRAIAFFIFILSTISMILCVSRTALIAAGGGLLVVSLFRRMSRSALGIVLISVLLLTFLEMMPYERGERFLYGGTSFRNRVMAWKDATRVFRENILSGVGPAQYFEHSRVTIIEPISRSGWRGSTIFEKIQKGEKIRYKWRRLAGVHNDYLQLAAEMGVFGIGAMITVIILLLRDCLFIIRKSLNAFTKGWAVGMLGLTIAYGISGIAGSTMLPTYLNGGLIFMTFSIYYWIFFGLMLAMHRQELSARASEVIEN